MEVEFGEWLPDLRDRNNPGAIEAKNCIGLEDGYTQLKALQSFTDALASACLGSAWFKDDGSNIYNFAGDAADLYSLTSSLTWDEISKTTNAYSCTDQWEFQKFGERVIATNIADPVQYYDMGTSLTFADLAGSPPQASRVAVVRDFVVLGDISGFPQRIHWCGFNNSELWTPNRSTQCDFQDIKGRGGRVQRLVPGEYGVIFQEHSISRMDYQGPPVVFRIDEVERGNGTPAPNSIVWHANLVYYYGYDGFYVFDGMKSVHIGNKRVNRWMQENLDLAAASIMRGVYDRLNGLIIWAFSSSGTSINNRLIIYNIRDNKWTYGEVDTQFLAEYASGGYNLDTLTSSLALADIDAASFNVDSAVYKGGALNIIAFDSSNKAATFDGAALTAKIVSKEIGQRGQSAFTRAVGPLVEGGSGMSIRVGYRDKPEANVAWTSPQAVNDFGYADVRIDARYQRYELTITGGFDTAYGVDVEGRAHRSRRA